jgi:hypothetical protein
MRSGNPPGDGHGKAATNEGPGDTAPNGRRSDSLADLVNIARGAQGEAPNCTRALHLRMQSDSLRVGWTGHFCLPIRGGADCLPRPPKDLPSHPSSGRARPLERVKANEPISRGVAQEPGHNCIHCGGPNPSGSLNCQWCGSELALPSLQTSPSTTAVMPELPELPEQSSAETDKEETNYHPESVPWARILAVLVGFVVIIAAVAALASLSPPSSPPPPPSAPAYPVNVTMIQLASPDDLCDLNGDTEPGFQGVSDAASGETWHVTGPPEGCTITGFTSETAGIRVISSDVPQEIPAGATGTISVSFILSGLGGPYAGSLQIWVS